LKYWKTKQEAISSRENLGENQIFIQFKGKPRYEPKEKERDVLPKETKSEKKLLEHSVQK